MTQSLLVFNIMQTVQCFFVYSILLFFFLFPPFFFIYFWSKMLILICFISCIFSVSAEILKSSLSTMERHIQRLENDIENFPKTDDPQDKFVAKMSISFLLLHLHFCMSTFVIASHVLDDIRTFFAVFCL